MSGSCENQFLKRKAKMRWASLLFEHTHDVALLHDEEILGVDFDLGARPFAEQHLVALLEIDGDQLAGFVAAARADSDDLALLRLLPRGIGDEDAAGGFGFRVRALDRHAIMERAKVHCCDAPIASGARTARAPQRRFWCGNSRSALLAVECQCVPFGRRKRAECQGIPRDAASALPAPGMSDKPASA